MSSIIWINRKAINGNETIYEIMNVWNSNLLLPLKSANVIASTKQKQ